jgi:hypothetical protein
MEWLWTRVGMIFGYRDGGNLWTHDGKHVGKFYEDEVCGEDGAYLGEIRNGRLITRTMKRSRHKSPFTPRGDRVGYVNRVDYVGYVMLAGFEDFPNPSRF